LRGARSNTDRRSARRAHPSRKATTGKVTSDGRERKREKSQRIALLLIFLRRDLLTALYKKENTLHQDSRGERKKKRGV